MTGSEAARERALRHFETFCQHMLEGTLRRIAIWKGVGPRILSQWREEARQELAVDCLQFAEQIATMNADERHARWMRHAARVTHARRRPLVEFDELADERATGGLADTVAETPLPFERLQNGRINLTATQRRGEQSRRALRQQIKRLGVQLGWDKERATFWQARAGEALTGLAADLIRIRHPLRVVGDQHALPDPERRRLRLRRIVRRLPVHPSTLVTRRALRPWARGRGHEGSASQLLETATKLAPQAPASWLWLFEARFVERDLAAAMRAIRCSRQHATASCYPPSRSATVLARARVLEARGRFNAGMALLQRAARRWPRERLLAHVLQPPRQTTTPA